MAGKTDARVLSEDDLGQIQGAAVIQTPADGWGSDARSTRSFPTLSNVMKIRHDTASEDESFSGQDGREPNV